MATISHERDRNRFRAEQYAAGSRVRAFGRTELEARNRLAAKLAALGQDTAPEPLPAATVQLPPAAAPPTPGGAPLPLESLLGAWIDARRADWRPHSLIGAEKSRAKLCTVLGADFNVRTLDALGLDRAKAAMGSLSRATRRRHLVALSAACRFAVRRKLLGALPIPAGEWELPKMPKPEPRTIAPTDLPRLLNAAPHPRIRVALALAAFGGLRAGEISTLRWSDVAEGAVHVRAEHAKSSRARAVPIVPPLAAELARWRTAEPPADPGALVLGREVHDLQHPVSRAFRDAELYDPAIRPGLHCLRRFAATTLARALAPADLRDAMGWSSIALAAHYCEAARSRQRLAEQAAAAFAEVGL